MMGVRCLRRFADDLLPVNSHYETTVFGMVFERFGANSVVASDVVCCAIVALDLFAPISEPQTTKPGNKHGRGLCSRVCLPAVLDCGPGTP